MSTRSRIRKLKDNICRTVGHDYKDSVCTRCKEYMPAQALLEGHVGSLYGVNIMVSDNVPRDIVAWNGKKSDGFVLIGSDNMVVSIEPVSKKKKKSKAKKKNAGNKKR